MKKFLFLFFSLTLLNACCPSKWDRVKYHKTKYKAFNSISKKQKLLLLSEQFLGIKFETPALKNDDLYRFDAFDCVTFVETAIGMIESKYFGDFKKKMLETRYFENKQDVKNRRHFFYIDYILQHKNLFKDITSEIANEKLQTKIINIDKKGFLKKIHNINSENVVEKYTIKYIPSKFAIDIVNGALNQKNDVKIVLFVPNDNELKKISSNIDSDIDVIHIGLLYKNEKNQLTLRHASKNAKEVIDMNFAEYLKNFTRSGGIIIVDYISK